MRSVQLDMTIFNRCATDVYRTLSDFGRYPEFTPRRPQGDVTQAARPYLLTMGGQLPGRRPALGRAGHL